MNGQVVVYTTEYDGTKVFKELSEEDLIEIDVAQYEYEPITREILAGIKEKLDRIRIPAARTLIQEWYNDIVNMLEEEEGYEKELREEQRLESERRAIIKQDPQVQSAINLLKARGINIIE